MSAEKPAFPSSLHEAAVTSQACTEVAYADLAKHHDEVFQVEVEVRTRGEHSGTFGVTCTLHDRCQATERNVRPDPVEYTSPDGLLKRYLFRYPHQPGRRRTVALCGDMLDVASNKMLYQEDVRGWRVRTKGRRKKVHYAVEVQSQARYAKLIIDGEPHELELPWSLSTDEDAEYFGDKGDHKSEKMSASEEMQSDKTAKKETEEDNVPSTVYDELLAGIVSVEDKPYQEAAKLAPPQEDGEKQQTSVSTEEAASNSKKTYGDLLSKKTLKVPAISQGLSQGIHTYSKEQLVVIIQNSNILHHVLHIGLEYFHDNHLAMKHLLIREALQDLTTILAVLAKVPGGIFSEHKYLLVPLRDVLKTYYNTDEEAERTFQSINLVRSGWFAPYADFLVFALANGFLSTLQFNVDLLRILQKALSQVCGQVKAQCTLHEDLVHYSVSKLYCFDRINIQGALETCIRDGGYSSLVQDCSAVCEGRGSSIAVSGKDLFSINEHKEKHFMTSYRHFLHSSQNDPFPLQYKRLSVNGNKYVHYTGKQEKKDKVKRQKRPIAKVSGQNFQNTWANRSLWEEAERLPTADWPDAAFIEKAIELLQDILMMNIDAISNLVEKLDIFGEEDQAHRRVFTQAEDMFTEMSTLGEVLKAFGKRLREMIGKGSHWMRKLAKMSLIRKLCSLTRRLVSVLRVMASASVLCAPLVVSAWRNAAFQLLFKVRRST